MRKKTTDNTPIEKYTPSWVIDELSAKLDELRQLAQDHNVVVIAGVALYDKLERKEFRSFLVDGQPSAVLGLSTLLNDECSLYVDDLNEEFVEGLDDGGADDGDGDVRVQ